MSTIEVEAKTVDEARYEIGWEGHIYYTNNFRMTDWGRTLTLEGGYWAEDGDGEFVFCQGTLIISNTDALYIRERR